MKNKSAVILALCLSMVMPVFSAGLSYKTIKGNTTAVAVGNAGPVLLWGVILSSGTGTQEYLILRDSNTANSTSAVAIPPVVPTVNMNSGALWFNPPIQFTNGISANLVQGLSTGTVIYQNGGR